MKERTIYDVLDEVMKDYTYKVKKQGNVLDYEGWVYIPQLDETVHHEAIHYFNDKNHKEYNDAYMEDTAKSFKATLKDKVVKVLLEHKEELTDDARYISSLLEKIKKLNKEIDELKEKISRLENDQYIEPGIVDIPVPNPAFPNIGEPWPSPGTPFTPYPYPGTTPYNPLDTGKIWCSTCDAPELNHGMSAREFIEKVLGDNDI